MAPDERKIELITQLYHQRQLLDSRKEDLSTSLNVKQRFVDSVKRHPLTWVGGSLLTTTLLSGLIRLPKRKHDHKKRGLIAFAITSGLALAKPAAKAWLVNQLKQELGKRLTTSAQTRNFHQDTKA